MKQQLQEIKDDLKRIGYLNLILIFLFFSLAFGVNQYSISIYSQKENVELVHFCKDSYHNESFINLFHDKEPYVLKTCYDRDRKNVFKMHAENYKEDYCPEITEEQLRFSKNCGWMDKDYFLLILRIVGGFFIPMLLIGFMVVIIIGSTNQNSQKKEKEVIYNGRNTNSTGNN